MSINININELNLPNEIINLLSSVKDKDIAVAVSGGIDSSVTALLFKLAGANVRAVMMKHINNNIDIKIAKRVTDYLDIPLDVIDLRSEFKKDVIDYFIEEYERGRTPNPCVVCNMKIKFGFLLNKALRGSDYFSTGHYVIKEKQNDRWVIKRAIDKNKDQSYALSMLTQDQIANCIFPLGYMKKNKTKELAKRFKLPVRYDSESMDLCFTKNRRGFLRGRIGERGGVIINKNEKVLGYHNGIQYFAIGQRKGIGLTSEEAYYVMDINANENKVIVGNKNELFTDKFFVSSMNWVSIDKPKPRTPIDADVMVRNKMKPLPCTIHPNSNKNSSIIVTMKKPIWAVAPGQLAVFYKDDLVLGGGWIV